MSGAAKVADIEDEENVFNQRIRLTKNEYYATIRNKLEQNRLDVVRRFLEDQNDLKSCKLRSSIHEIRKDENENKKVVCKVDDFIRRRNVQSATTQSRVVRSSFARFNDPRSNSRAKSASTLSRPCTAPLQPFYDFMNDQDDSDTDDEALPISLSRATSAKLFNTRPTSVVSTLNPVHQMTNDNEQKTPTEQQAFESSTTANHRITWPVKMRVFSLPDENEFRKELLAWRAEQRKLKVRPVQKTFIDIELERKYQESIRRRKEIEAVITPELIRQYKMNDPVFAKRYRQLKLSVRSGKVPCYDPHDLNINGKLSKSNIERAKSALATSHQKKMQNFYRTQQNFNETQLSKRIEAFLSKLAEMKKEQT